MKHFADITAIYQAFLKYRRVSTDSRKIVRGSVFFALKGEKFNGNHYAASAIENGAACAVVDEEAACLDDSYFLVKDSLECLQQLATMHRDNFNLPLIAITGSNGKTTTKELVTAVLSSKYCVLSTSGNLNNHIGVPLSLLRINKETDMAVIEMGANHPGEIAFLCSLARPDYGIITNIGKAHMEGFGSYQGVIAAKSELYGYLDRHGGRIFQNADDKVLKSLNFPEDRIMTYSTKKDSGIRGKLLAQDPFLRMKWYDQTGRENTPWQINTNLFGSYNIYNVLAATSVGRYFGIPGEEINKAVAAYQPRNNRSQLVRAGSNQWLMDAYNANPTSMMAALNDFSRLRHERKIIILGDMKELGDDEIAEHRKILKYIEKEGFEQVYLVGEVFPGLNNNRNFRCFNSAGELAGWFEQYPPEDSFILLKASRAIRLEIIYDRVVNKN